MESKQLAKLFWDYQVTERELQDCLAKNDLNDPLTVSLYNRILLGTPSWYQVLRMLSSDQLRSALSPRVLSTIQSNAVQERFRFAAAILFGRI